MLKNNKGQIQEVFLVAILIAVTLLMLVKWIIPTFKILALSDEYLTNIASSSSSSSTTYKAYSPSDIKNFPLSSIAVINEIETILRDTLGTNGRWKFIISRGGTSVDKTFDSASAIYQNTYQLNSVSIDNGGTPLDITTYIKTKSTNDSSQTSNDILYIKNINNQNRTITYKLYRQ